jgi:hypothetical protein
VVEVVRASQVGVDADDAVDDFFAGAYAVESAGVTAEPEDLPGAGEQLVVAGCDAEGSAFGTPVSPVVVDVGVVGELDCRCRTAGLGQPGR